MKINFKNYDKYIIKTPLITLFIDRLNKNKIPIFNLKEIEKDTYSFYSFSKNKKNLLKFKDTQIINSFGVLNFIRKHIKRKTTLISLITSICLYLYASNRIINIEIKGNDNKLIPVIKEELNINKISLYNKKLTTYEALNYEKIILSSLKKEIEWIEIRQVGVKLKVNFLKRRVAPILPSVGTSIYAQKDGMIVRFEVTSGVKMVKEFDYVKKGDLLVSDTLITSSEESKYIGAYGSVYAYTWYNVECSYAVKNNKKIDELEIYNLLLEDNRAKIDKELTGNDEFLVKEQILSFKNDNNKYRLKIHYTLLEDITL